MNLSSWDVKMTCAVCECLFIFKRSISDVCFCVLTNFISFYPSPMPIIHRKDIEKSVVVASNVYFCFTAFFYCHREH